MQLDEVLRHFAECPDRPRFAALFDGVGALLDLPQNSLGHRSRLVGCQATVFAERNTARAPVLTILSDIDLLARGEGGDAEAGQRVVPEELTVFPLRAKKAVN